LPFLEKDILKLVKNMRSDPSMFGKDVEWESVLCELIQCYKAAGGRVHNIFDAYTFMLMYCKPLGGANTVDDAKRKAHMLLSYLQAVEQKEHYPANVSRTPGTAKSPHRRAP
jgi:hypothetical protein